MGQSHLSFSQSKVENKIVWVFDDIAKYVDDAVDQNSAFVNWNKKQKLTFKQDKLNNFIPFWDIDNCKHKNAINIIKEKWIAKWYNNNFYPQNHARLYVYLKILIESYREKIWYDLDSDLWFFEGDYFPNLALSVELKKYINTAYEMWLLDWIVEWLDPDMLVDHEISYKILKNFVKQYPKIVNIEYFEKLYPSDVLVTNEQMVTYIVDFLELESDLFEDWNLIFEDTFYHKFGPAVERLAEFDIVNTHNPNFFIDKVATRADFLVILVNSLLYLNDEDISSVSISGWNISDINNLPYMKHIQFAYDQGLIDYLLITERWETKLLANKPITKHEVYTILSQHIWYNLDYDENLADNENITRWELAQIIVNAYDFVSFSKKVKIHYSADLNDWQDIDFWKAFAFWMKIKTFFDQ